MYRWTNWVREGVYTKVPPIAPSHQHYFVQPSQMARATAPPTFYRCSRRGFRKGFRHHSFISMIQDLEASSTCGVASRGVGLLHYRSKTEGVKTSRLRVPSAGANVCDPNKPCQINWIDLLICIHGWPASSLFIFILLPLTLATGSLAHDIRDARDEPSRNAILSTSAGDLAAAFFGPL